MASHTDSKTFILVRLSGDIGTKSRRTRVHFLRCLRSNLVDALASAAIPYEIERSWTRFFIETPEREAAAVLARVFGVQSLSVAKRRRWEDLEDLVRSGEELFAPHVQGRRFAVRARRGSARERIPFRSYDIERELGTALLPYALKVDLDHPEVTVRVELDADQAYFFTEQVPAHGGLPVGTEGRALALVSGGFDSAVASWLMLKRGVRLDYLFYNLGGASHQEGALEVMKVVAQDWSYGYTPRLYAVDLRPAVEELQARARSHNWQVLLKRLMFRGADLLAQRIGSSGLITGEALGQVSSQTLKNLAVISQVTRLPILRPLLGFNKDEIVQQARWIGTFDLSAKVPEYCALDARPTTQASLEEVEDDEAKLDLDRLGPLMSEATPYDLRHLDPKSAASFPQDLTIDEVPPQATLIDLRSAHAFAAWHYPGALRLDYLDALARVSSFDRKRTYVVCCEVEFKSATLAEKMRRAGLETFHFRGGAKALLAYATARGLVEPSLVAPALLESP